MKRLFSVFVFFEKDRKKHAWYEKEKKQID